MSRGGVDLHCGGFQRESGKVGMSVFLRTSRNGSDAAGCCGVGRLTARGIMEGFNNGEDHKSCPCLSLSVTPRSVTQPTSGRRGFRPVPVHVTEGGCLDTYSLHIDRCSCKGEQVRFNNMFRNVVFGNMLFKRVRSSLQLHRNVAKKRNIRPPSCGPDLEPPSDRATAPRSSGAEYLRVRRPGQTS